MKNKDISIILIVALVITLSFNFNYNVAAVNPSIEITTDKNDGNIGDVITAEIKVKDIPNLAGIRVDIKYDPSILKPVLGSGADYASKTYPEGGTILQNSLYGVYKIVDNDVSKGLISFSRTYTGLDAYRDSNAPETTGVVAFIKFKILDRKYTTIRFSSEDQKHVEEYDNNGVMLIDWNVNPVEVNYTVTNAIIDFGQSPPVSPTPSPTPTVAPTPTPRPSSGGGGGGGVRATPTPTPTPTGQPIQDVKISYTEGSNTVSGGLTRELILTSRDNNVIYINVDAGLADIHVNPHFIDVDGNLSKVLLDIVKNPTDGTVTIKGTVENKDGTKSNIDYEFNKPIQIYLPYSLGPNETKDNITVFLMTDDGNMINLMGKYNEATGKIDFYTDQFGKFVIKPHNVSFADVKDDYWGKKYIEAMAAKGILSGRELDMFYPEEGVTRAEFTKLITMVLGLVDYKAVNIFTDITNEHWYGLYIASAYKHGIVKGRPDGTFGPNDTITRQDMAAIVARALKGNLAEYSIGDLSFNDNNSISDYAISSIAYAVKNGLVLGRPGDIMDPKGTTNRAESAVLMYRIFNGNYN